MIGQEVLTGRAAVFFAAAWATLFVAWAAAAKADPLPEAGLVLWLRDDQGVELSAGRVVRWRDQSGAGHDAEVPAEFVGPTCDAAAGGLAFGRGTALRIPAQILPPDARELTVLGVARADSPSSIGLFSIRNAARPLVQLDVDEQAQARFIVRDGQGQTLAATTPCVLNAQALFGGILTRHDAATGGVQVLFGANRQAGTEARFASPIIAPGAWIGALAVPGMKTYSWDGAIAEILVYDRALPTEEWDQAVAYLTQTHRLRPPVPPVFADSWNVLNGRRADRPVAKELQTDVCVVGGGSGGVAAAIAAARQGARVLLVERQRRLGGTGTNALVSSWEPGPGCSIAEELFRRMKAIGGAGVARSQPVQTTAPMGFLMVTDDEPYERTLIRALPGDRQRRRVPYCVPYQPEAFDTVVRQMLEETGNATVLDETTFFHAEPNEAGTRVEAILVEAAAGDVARIRARVFIDSTGDVWLARALGCELMLGTDPRARFDEPSAPEQGALQLNAITRCYSIVPREQPRREPPPEVPVAFPRAAFVTGWQDGIRMVNMMPTLPGRALIDLGYDECLRRTEPIVRAHWHWLQQVPEFHQYELAEIAPMLGIRESYRVVTRYVLTEHDLRAGLPGQPHADLIAVADHPCDIHGAGGHLAMVPTAYGVPYRCLLPAGAWENLLVACRGAGFSKIAASSVRLQRTMIQLGHAAGLAAAMAVQQDTAVDRIDVDRLVQRLAARARYPLDESFVVPQPVSNPR
jgi:hypothetical protein